MRKLGFAFAAAAVAGSLSGAVQADEKSTTSVVRSTSKFIFVADEQDEVKPEEDSANEDKSSDESTAEKTTESREVVVEVLSSSEASSDESDGDDDKKPVQKVRGRIIMIGPDGKRQEMELDEKQLKKFHLDVGDGQAFIRPEQSDEESNAAEKVDADQPEMEERYVIGVQCEEADEVLRKHLKLEGKGLLILEVREKTPAANAGLQVDDVIVAVGEVALQSRDDLVTAVHESEGKELAVQVLRSGESMTVNITPKKMKVPVAEKPATVEGFAMPNIILQNGKPMTALPGLLLEGQPQDPAEVGKLVQRLQKEYLLQVDEEKSKLEDEMESLRKELKALRQEIQELQKATSEK